MVMFRSPRTGMLIALVLLLAPTLFIGSVKPVDINVLSQSSGWLTGWQYRKSHTIEGSVGAGTNYQVKIAVHRTTDTDNGADVYLGTKCRYDFSDIRFVDDDGVTLLDYWIEESNSTTGQFWVEFKDNLDTDQLVYIYYGNDAATSLSDGETTFLFFDDFNDRSLDTAKWDSFGTWTESGGLASLSLNGTGSSIEVPVLRTDNGWDMRNKSLAARWQFDVNSVNGQWGMSCKDGAGQLSYFLGESHLFPSTSDNYFDLDHSGGAYDHDVDVIDAWPDGTFFRTEFSSTPNGVTKNEWFLDHMSVSVYNGNSFSDVLQRILLGFYAIGNYTFATGSIKMDFDWVYLRTQVGLDPAHGMWGVEEEFQPTSTTPTTTSPTSTTSPTTPSGPEGFDWMILGIFGGAGIGIVVIVIIVIFSRRGGSG